MPLTEAQATKFAGLALAHVSREFPNKLDHVMRDARDVAGPRALHPIFFGSFDWHSCVHGYWLLARVLRRFPDLTEAARIRSLFNERITEQNVAAECEYAAAPGRAGFERPYGWAWLLMLSAELARHDTEVAGQWSRTLAPLAALFTQRFLDFLPRCTYPVRVGTHYNTAFAVALAHEYATATNHEALTALLRDTALRWYSSDADAQAWEPGGDDFLSGTLVEAECMRRIMPASKFAAWFDAFLPRVKYGEPRTLFVPAVVSDRTDGKIAHLDGLNLSRAWCWRSLASAWPVGDARYNEATGAASIHLGASLPHVAGDYMGEHWLATYAVLALDDHEELGQ